LLDSVVLLAEIITSLAQLIQSLLQAVTVLLLLLLSYRMLLLQLWFRLIRRKRGRATGGTCLLSLKPRAQAGEVKQMAAWKPLWLK
jgi:hypothetical protein